MSDDHKDLCADSAVQFLLAEFNVLQSGREAVERYTANRVNFFLAIATAAGATLTLGSDVLGGDVAYAWFSVCLLAVVLAFGVILFLRTTESSITATKYVRAMNLIRSYFTEAVPEVRSYLAWPASADSPGFRARGADARWRSAASLGSMVAVVNSSIMGFIVSIGLHGGAGLSLASGIGFGLLAGLLSFLIQMWLRIKRLQLAEQQWAAEHNSPKTESERT